MDYEEDLRDTLHGDILDSYRECLVCVSVLAVVCSFVHIYTVNISHAVADFILGLETKAGDLPTSKTR
ncbi:hypothetical protein BEWA_022880 [Theileria equi strain WA]|uniref:Uncharacterized protein n=1 Tax=Theileria equi strain WA TaxID=1537102 RepID=L0AV78_THEEQ|nr:hypothetical protein BEWA_022880 [Theileria equi strain WA]AFZ79440.1 hypothetical protein BEWA_022880 [Theileria equi strain WA]|eukprot:XP_004829106.1 hypothetical protein BEWA_022880 [Theileria equi strain WA]